MSLYKHFHNHVKKSRQDTIIPIDPKDWPEEWGAVYFKEYPRFPKVKLVLSKQKPGFNLFRALQERKSEREFSGKPIDIRKLSQFLVYSAGVQKNLKSQISNLKSSSPASRTYPSGGGRYPIELYPVVLKGGKEIPLGIYHLNVEENILENLWQLPADFDVKNLLVGDWQNASLIILMSVIFDRTINKYQDFGYRLIWAECGHIGQNFYLLSQALGLKCCACAGVDEDYANEILDIDGREETVLMAYIFGR